MSQSKKSAALAIIVAVSICSIQARAQNQNKSPYIELNTILMQTTFMIGGPGIGGGYTRGTAFLLGRPVPSDPTKSEFVLVTAAHVLEAIQGEWATLNLRQKTPTGDWAPLQYQLQIRAGARPLWTRNPHADVAVMYAPLPNAYIAATPMVAPVGLLADDSLLSRYEIHPGDRLECLGYPLGLPANSAGFPVLRSGIIASYPLLPTDKMKTFLFDFRVFEGNSGGPVYFTSSNRLYGGTAHPGQQIRMIVGLVTQQEFAQEPFREQNEMGVRQKPLDLGVVVDASLIRQAIAMLPPPQLPTPRN